MSAQPLWDCPFLALLGRNLFACVVQIISRKNTPITTFE